MKQYFITFTAICLFFLSACSSSSTNNNNNNNNSTTPTAPSITYSTGDGYIVAVNTITSTTVMGVSTEMPMGTGIAAFGNLAAGTFSDAGAVSLNGKTLTKNTNNVYYFTPTATDITGISFDSDINWSVTNPSFTYSAKSSSGGRGMPNNTKISGTFTSIDVNSDFTLAMTNAVGNADSVYFQITGTSKSIIKRTGGSEKSVTFTSAELKTLGNTTYGSIVIAPWNHELKTLGGKQIHVINELALAKVVEIK